MAHMRGDIERARGTVADQGNGTAHGVFRFPQDLAVFRGHFPDYPVVPGVYLLAAAQDVVKRVWSGSWELSKVVEAKFRGVVLPDVAVVVEAAFRPGENGHAIVHAEVKTEEGRDLVARFDMQLAKREA